MKDKKSLKEKWKAHLPHKRGAEEKQKKGTEDTGFTIHLARFIIEKRAWIESVFIAGCIFCAIAMLFVNVNYDLTKYVPSTAQSSMGLDVMKKEFGYPGTARRMLKDVACTEQSNTKIKSRPLTVWTRSSGATPRLISMPEKISSIWMISKTTTRTAARSWISPLMRNQIPRRPRLPSMR